MKKAIIALAVAAGSIAAAQAANTTTLYGSVAFSSTIAKSANLSASSTVDAIKDNNWDIATTAAKIGVEGTEDLDNGLQAFFKIEAGPGGQTNYAYLGLTGDFGTLTIGKQKTLLKVITDTGLFNEVGIGYNFTGSNEFKTLAGIQEDLPTGYPGTVSKAISYVTPPASGFQLGASVIADGDNAASKGADAWEVGALYNANGWNTGVVYTYVNAPVFEPRSDGSLNTSRIIGKDGSIEFTGLNIGYSNDQFGVVGRAVHQSSMGTEYGLEGEYYSGPNTFRAGVGVYDPKGGNNVYNYALGYQYNFSKRTYTWVEGQYSDYNVDGVDNGFKALVGIRHDF